MEALAVIVLLAVGSDYNLLLVSRFKEEIHAGLKTGIIRSMAGTGGVVTAAGLVFAFTMASMVGSDMRAIGQFGSTVCVGLLLDTLIVRALLMPSIATLLGRWFWWPQRVHTRGADNVRPPSRAVLMTLRRSRAGPAEASQVDPGFMPHLVTCGRCALRLGVEPNIRPRLLRAGPGPPAEWCGGNVSGCVPAFCVSVSRFTESTPAIPARARMTTRAKSEMAWAVGARH